MLWLLKLYGRKTGIEIAGGGCAARAPVRGVCLSICQFVWKYLSVHTSMAHLMSNYICATLTCFFSAFNAISAHYRG